VDINESTLNLPLGAHYVFQLGALDSINVKGAEVRCPAGELALGGGFNLGKVEPQPPVAVQMSLPLLESGTGRPVGWRMSATEVGSYAENWRPVAGAICAPSS
jgi:hypothetical protein